MNVDGALDVEAGENGPHLHHAVLVRRPHAAQPGSVIGVQVRHANLEIGDVQLLQEEGEAGVGRQSGKAGIASRGVAVPERDESVGKRLAGRHIDEPDVEPQRHAGLILGHVLAKRLGSGSLSERSEMTNSHKDLPWPDIRTLGHLRAQHASIVLDDIVIRSLGGDLISGVAGACGEIALCFCARVVTLFVQTSHGACTTLGKVRAARQFSLRDMVASGMC